MLKGGLLAASVVLATLFVFCSVGCFEIVSVEKDYQLSIRPLLETWKSVINTWESEVRKEKTYASRYKDIQQSITKMEWVIGQWNKIIPPQEYKDFHLWMKVAMGYDLEIRRGIQQYWEASEVDNFQEMERLEHLGRELAALKDKALFAAQDAFPQKQKRGWSFRYQY